MPVYPEITRYILEEVNLRIFDNTKDALDFLNSDKFDWRSSLTENIIKDDMPEFIKFLETRISQPFQTTERIKFINIRAYSYINFKGTVVNVRAHTRKRK